MLKSKFFKFILWVLIFSIFILSIIKVPQSEDLPSNSDKFVHLLMYFVCAGAFYMLGFKRFFLISFFYGCINEAFQVILPWRSFDFFDIVANSIGIILFYFCLPYLKKSFAKLNIV